MSALLDALLANPRNQTLYGMPVQISARVPRIQCSAEFVRIQTPELVARTNKWMEEFFGYTELVPDGRIYKLPGDILAMNEATWNKVRKAFAK
jgi:hypothetical protein